MAAKKLNYRLPILTEDKLDDAQRALLESLRAGPRGDRVKLGGPFGVYMHAPQYGELTQLLGAFLRFKTSLEPRLSEFAILCTARMWRSQYEWHAHAPIAEKAGVKAEVIRDIKAGRTPKKAAKDERAIFDFVPGLPGRPGHRRADRNSRLLHRGFHGPQRLQCAAARRRRAVFCRTQVGGGGRGAYESELRGEGTFTLRESALVETPPHPDPLHSPSIGSRRSLPSGRPEAGPGGPAQWQAPTGVNALMASGEREQKAAPQ